MIDTLNRRCSHSAYGQFYLLPQVRIDWLDFNATTWPHSKHFAAGMTKNTSTELYLDKIAEWAYKSYIENTLVDNLPELAKLSRKLDRIGDGAKRLALQKQAADIIHKILFVNETSCKGVKVKRSQDKKKILFYCMSHQCVNKIHERVLVDRIIRMTSEVTIHELIHGLHNEQSNGETLYDVFKQRPSEPQVLEMGIMLAETQDLNTQTLTDDDTSF